MTMHSLSLDSTDEELETLESLYPNSTGSEKCLNHMKERELFIKSSPRAIYSRQLRKTETRKMGNCLFRPIKVSLKQACRTWPSPVLWCA